MLKKIKVSNLKSFKECEIELKAFNILVGPNGAGKTNFVELFKLLHKIYSEREISPFLDWWGYDNIVWKRNENLPIIIKLFFEEGDYEFSFETTFTGIGGKFQILREEIEVKDYFSLRKEGEQLKVIHNEKFFNEAVERIFEAAQEKKAPFFADRDELKTFLTKKLRLQTQEIKVREESLLFLPALRGILYRDEKLSITRLFARHAKTPEAKEGALTTFYVVTPTVRGHKNARSPFIDTRLSRFVERNLCEDVIERFFSLAREATFLKNPNYSEIRNPSRPKRGSRLSEDANNFLNVLYTLFLKENKFPPRIVSIMSYIFPEMVMKFDLTSDGRVLLIVREGKIELNPPSLPDGFYKTLIILTALELKSSMLLIDEVENTLHPKALELLIDEIKASKVQTVLTTHSPAMVDLAEPEDLILVERDPDEGSKFRRIEDAEEVKRFLREKGITLSERWLYGRV